MKAKTISKGAYENIKEYCGVRYSRWNSTSSGYWGAWRLGGRNYSYEWEIKAVIDKRLKESI